MWAGWLDRGAAREREKGERVMLRYFCWRLSVDERETARQRKRGERGSEKRERQKGVDDGVCVAVRLCDDQPARVGLCDLWRATGD